MQNVKIAVIGLGYVGLPLARLFSTKYKTVGFDMNQKRVDALMQGHDATLEVSDELLQDAINNHGFVCTTDLEKIKECNFYVVAVPTPVDENNRPDLKPLWGASETVEKVVLYGRSLILFLPFFLFYIYGFSSKGTGYRYYPYYTIIDRAIDFYRESEYIKTGDRANVKEW